MLLFNRYEYNPQSDLLGKGGFSRVYKALDKKLNRFVALKIYKTGDVLERYSLGSEIQRVINLDHPNVSRYLDIDDLENENAFGEVEKIQVCVMELLDGGSILTYYKVNPENAILIKLLVDVLDGLAYLHQNDIIHRDIKPGNILIKNTKNGPVAKITDFGISKISSVLSNPDSSSALIVSIPYMAPEQLNAKKFGIDGRVSFNIDLWSLGVAVYEIVSGDILFKNNPEDSPEQIMLNIMAPGIPEKINQLPEPFCSFVAKCVIKDARERPDDINSLIALLQNKPAQPARKDQQSETPTPGIIEITGNLPLVAGGVIDIPSSNVAIEKTGKTLPMDQEIFSAPGNIFQNNLEESTESKEFPNGVTQNISPDIISMNTPDRVSQTGETGTTDNKETGYRHSDIEKIEVEYDTEETQVLNLKVKHRGEAEDAPGITQRTLDPGPVTDESNDDTQMLQPLIFSKQDNQDDTALLALEPRPRAMDDDDTQILNPLSAGKTAATEDKEPEKNGTVNAREETENKILLFKRYEYYPNKNLIGKGGFSRVYKAFDKKLQRWVALKIYKTGNFSDRYSPIAEIQRVVNLDHSNICRYLDIEEIEKVNPFGEKETIQVCVMELLDSGNLLQYFEENPDPKIFKKLLRDIFMGLSYLHKNGIIHRDIKPANILIKQTIDGPIAKITDFGISKKSDAVNNNSSSALVVSIPYMAPEQLNVKKYGTNGRISFNLDLWSLGVTIYEVLSGKVLFKNNEADNSEQIMTNIMAAELPDKIRDLDSPFAEIVFRCIVKKAPERAQRVEELLEILSRDSNQQALLPATAYSLPAPVGSIDKPAERPGTPLPPTEKNAEPVARSGFYVLEDDVKVNDTKSSSGKKYFLLGLILVVLLIGTATILFIKKNDSSHQTEMPAEGNRNAFADTVAIVRHPLPVDSMTKRSLEKISNNKPVAASPPKSNRENENVVEKKRKKEEVISEKTIAKRERIGGDTYLLELNASVDCIVKINSFNYGEIKAHGKMKVWLATGNYQIKVTNMADNTEIYSKSVDVIASQLGSVGHLQIK